MDYTLQKCSFRLHYRSIYSNILFVENPSRSSSYRLHDGIGLLHFSLWFHLGVDE